VANCWNFASVSVEIRVIKTVSWAQLLIGDVAHCHRTCHTCMLQYLLGSQSLFPLEYRFCSELCFIYLFSCV